MALCALRMPFLPGCAGSGFQVLSPWLKPIPLSVRSGSGEQAKSFLDLRHREPISKARTHSLYVPTWAQVVEVICDLK